MVPDSIYQKVCESWQKGEKLWGNATNSYLRVGWWWDILLLHIIILCTICFSSRLTYFLTGLQKLWQAGELFERLRDGWKGWEREREKERMTERRIERMKIKLFLFFSISLSLMWRGSWVHECIVHVYPVGEVVSGSTQSEKKSLEFCNPGSRHS